MAPKRKHAELDPDPENKESIKPAKKGFTVGPDNLPDGTHRRKAQKIKSTLIHKAKVKKSYAKLKEREQLDSGPAYDPYTTTEDAPNPEEPKSPTLEIHPERQAMLDNPLPSPPPPSAFQGNATESRPRKAPKFRPFVKESEHARNKREVAEVRREAIEESNRQRNEKLADRERMRRMTATARKPDRNGQRRLGRESKVLLERVKRLVGK